MQTMSQHLTIVMNSKVKETSRNQKLNVSQRSEMQSLSKAIVELP
jgi:hypothetical protein